MTSYLVPLSAAQLDTIGTGLYELPYKVASPLIDYLRQQVAQHDAARTQAERPAEAATAAPAPKPKAAKRRR